MKNRAEPEPAARRARAPAKLGLTVQYAAAAADVPARPQFRKWVRAALSRDADITLRIVGEAEGRDLNRAFRGKDYATNVLTFAYADTHPLSGDIVLCAAVVEREARAQHKDPAAHYAHLTVHGVLHLQGWDHDSDAAAAAMEQLETAIVTRLGYGDPYAARLTEQH